MPPNHTDVGNETTVSPTSYQRHAFKQPVHKGIIEIAITGPSVLLSVVIVIIIIRNKKFHTSGYMLMASLSLTSIVFCINRLLAIPAALMHQSVKLPRDFYKAVGAINTFMITSQRLHITLITVNRLVAVVFYLKYNDVFTVRRTGVMIALLWTLSVALYLPLCLGKVWYEFVPMVLRFSGGSAGPEYRPLGQYLLITNIIVGVLCVIAIIICYPVIMHAMVKRHVRLRDALQDGEGRKRPRGPKKEEVSLLVQFGIISLFHFAVWLFELAGTILYLTEFRTWDHVTALVYTVLSVLNLCLDPYIYLVFNKELRKDFVWLCLCRRQQGEVTHAITVTGTSGAARRHVTASTNV